MLRICQRQRAVFYKAAIEYMPWLLTRLVELLLHFLEDRHDGLGLFVWKIAAANSLFYLVLDVYRYLGSLYALHCVSRAALTRGLTEDNGKQGVENEWNYSAWLL
jgi:hypothetical protein